MSNALFCDTITLYNHYRDKATREDRWQRTVLLGVQVRRSVKTTVTEDGKLVAAEWVSVTIPVNVDAGGRHFLRADAFQDSQGKEKYWTLKTDKNLDVMVLGSGGPELGEGRTLRDLSGCFTVQAVSDNTNRNYLKHWKVVAV